MQTTTARMTRFETRRPLLPSVLFAGLAFAAAFGFATALVFGLIG